MMCSDGNQKGFIGASFKLCLSIRGDDPSSMYRKLRTTEMYVESFRIKLCPSLGQSEIPILTKRDI